MKSVRCLVEPEESKQLVIIYEHINKHSSVNYLFNWKLFAHVVNTDFVTGVFVFPALQPRGHQLLQLQQFQVWLLVLVTEEEDDLQRLHQLLQTLFCIHLGCLGQVLWDKEKAACITVSYIMILCVTVRVEDGSRTLNCSGDVVTDPRQCWGHTSAAGVWPWPAHGSEPPGVTAAPDLCATQGQQWKLTPFKHWLDL